MDGSPIATVVNFPIHGTVLGTSNLQISADIPGAIANELEKRTGGIVVYVNGAEGDVNPIVVSNDFSGLQTAAIGNAENIFAAWKTLKPHRPLKFNSVEETVNIGAPKLNAYACVEIRNKSGDWLIPIEALGLPRSASLSAFNIDDHLFITIPGEPVTRVGLQMKALGQAAHFKTTSIFGLTNDYIGYILTSDEYRLGLYESCSSFYGPELGDFMTQGVQTLVQQINPTDGSVNREEPKTLEPIK